MESYLSLVRKVLDEGVIKENRTGIPTKYIPAAIFEHDMKTGFPLLTSKKMSYKSIFSELEFFIKGIHNKKWLKERKNHIWDEWCSPDKVPYGTDKETQKRMAEEDELGPIYGFQWRNFNGDYTNYKKYRIDTNPMEAQVSYTVEIYNNNIWLRYIEPGDDNDMKETFKLVCPLPDKVDLDDIKEIKIAPPYDYAFVLTKSGVLYMYKEDGKGGTERKWIKHNKKITKIMIDNFNYQFEFSLIMFDVNYNITIMYYDGNGGCLETIKKSVKYSREPTIPFTDDNFKLFVVSIRILYITNGVDLYSLEYTDYEKYDLMVLKHILSTAKGEKITDVFSIKNGDDYIHILVLDNNTLIPMDNLKEYIELKIQYKMTDQLTGIFKQPFYTPKTLVTNRNIIKIGTWEYDECRKDCVSALMLMSNNKLYKIELEVIKIRPNTIYEIQLKELDVLLNREGVTNFYINNNNEVNHTDSRSYIHTVAIETKKGFYVNGCISKHLDSKKRVSVVKTNGFINVKEIYGETPDQLKICIDTMKSNPDSRRMIVSAWNPAQLKSMALPPCHTGFQIIVNKEQRYFDLIWSQRSCDLMLGIPYNIASYAALMHLIELETGYTANKLYGHLSDIHIYTNHYTGAVAQTLRPTHKLPKIITKNFSSIYDWEYTDTIIEDYVSEDKIVFEIAI